MICFVIIKMTTLVSSNSTNFNMYNALLKFVTKNVLRFDDSHIQDFKMYEEFDQNNKEIKLSGQFVANTIQFIFEFRIIIENSNVFFSAKQINKDVSYAAKIIARSVDDIYFYTDDKNKLVFTVVDGRATVNEYYDKGVMIQREEIENYDGGNKIINSIKNISGNQYYDKEKTKTIKRYHEINYYKNSKLNNKPGKPASISKNGTWKLEKYFVNGLPHRSPEKGKDKPAYIEIFNKKVIKEKYFIDGRMHRNYEPAYIEYNNKGVRVLSMWYSNNYLNNYYGPAYVEKYATGEIKVQQYFSFGRVHREDGPAIIFYDQKGNILKKEYYIKGVKIDKGVEEICGAKKSGIIFNLNIDNVQFCLDCSDIYDFLTSFFPKIKNDTGVIQSVEDFQTFLTTISLKNLDEIKLENKFYYIIFETMYEEWIKLNKDITRIKTSGDVDMPSSEELIKRMKKYVSINKFRNLIYAYVNAKSSNLCDNIKSKIIEISDEVDDYGKYLNTPSKTQDTAFVSGLCQGIVNERGVCWANSLIQFISPISDNIKFGTTESVIDKYCPSKKNYSGGSYKDFFDFLSNVQRKINNNKNIMEIFTKNSTKTNDVKYIIFFDMKINEILTIAGGNFGIGLSFDVNKMVEINSTHVIKSIFVNLPNHAVCIRLCKGNFYLFDDDDVIFIPYDLIEIIKNPSLLINLAEKYKNIDPSEVVLHSYFFEKVTI
jgi:hypothetical protein